MTDEEIVILKRLSKKLKRKASIEMKKVKNDITHYEGMCKGMWIGYNESATEIDKILREIK
jgi:hypothetical protein